MLDKKRTVGAVLLIVSGWCPRVLACGGGSVTTSGEVGTDAQRVVLAFRGDRTEVITQIAVPDTPGDVGVLLPVAGEPTIDPEPVDTEELDELGAATAPTISIADEGGGSGCGCGSDAATKGGASRGGGVTVAEPVAIGPVTATALTGENGDAVNGWLAENGFTLPEEHRDIVAAYSGPGRYFVAIRRAESAPEGGPKSLGVHFTVAGDQRVLPLGFARIGAAATVAFTLFVAADEPSTAAAPFETLTLHDLDGAVLTDEGYRSAVEKAVAGADSRAVVVEGVYDAESVIASGTTLATLIGSDQVVTRLSTVLSNSALTGDVGLGEPYEGEAPTYRSAALGRGFRWTSHPWASSVLAFAVAFVRKRRRR